MTNVIHDFSPSVECAKFVSNLTYQDLPNEVIDFVKKDILDWIGCAIAGSADPASQPIKKVTHLLGNNPQASVFGCEPMSVQHAALCNGYFSHIRETDDVDRDSISHPASINIPPAIALSEYLKKDGKSLILAVTAGFEIMLRIGASITPAHYQVFHTTSTAGIFGAAMAAGKMLGLSEIQLQWALGNAGTCSAGLWQFLPDGAMSKFIHTGGAAGNGVLVALLAQNGFSGAKHILEGKQGFFEGYARQDVNFDYFKDFGSKWRTALVSFKPYPCCRHTHSAIDAALDIRKQANGGKLSSITLFTYNAATNKAGKRAPANGREAKFSLTYCIASSILRGTPSERDFDNDKVNEQEVKHLESLIKLAIDDELNACVPRNWPARIEAVTEDGEKLVAQIRDPKGDPENAIDWEGISTKFMVMTDGIIPADAQQEIINACKNLENLQDPSSLIKKANISFTTKY